MENESVFEIDMEISGNVGICAICGKEGKLRLDVFDQNKKEAGKACSKCSAEMLFETEITMKEDNEFILLDSEEKLRCKLIDHLLNNKRKKGFLKGEILLVCMKLSNQNKKEAYDTYVNALKSGKIYAIKQGLFRPKKKGKIIYPQFECD